MLLAGGASRSPTAPHFVLSEADVVEMLLYPGWRAELAAGDGELARREVRAHLDRFCAAGMRYQLQGGRRVFDPIGLNFICEIGRTARDRFWRERMVAPRRALATALSPPGPRSERFHDPRRVVYELRREVVLPDRKPGSATLATLALPVPEPSHPEIDVVALDTPGTKITIDRGMLTARSIVDADHRVRFGVRITALAYQQSVAIDRAYVEPVVATAELAPYLAHEEGTIRVTPVIRELATRFLRDHTWDTVLAAWDHVFGERSLGSLYHFELDPADPLGSAGEWVDCYIGSALFVAILRALGIPGRMVSGALMYPGTDMGLHYWSEVFVQPYGWVPFDLHGWILAAGDPRDPQWGRFLVAHLPYQLVFHRLPRASLELGLRYPKRWYSTSTHDGIGQRHQVFDLDTGALAYTDYYIARIEAP